MKQPVIAAIVALSATLLAIGCAVTDPCGRKLSIDGSHIVRGYSPISARCK